MSPSTAEGTQRDPAPATVTTVDATSIAAATGTSPPASDTAATDAISAGARPTTSTPRRSAADATSRDTAHARAGRSTVLAAERAAEPPRSWHPGSARAAVGMLSAVTKTRTARQTSSPWWFTSSRAGPGTAWLRAATATTSTSSSYPTGRPSRHQTDDQRQESQHHGRDQVVVVRDRQRVVREGVEVVVRQRRRTGGDDDRPGSTRRRDDEHRGQDQQARRRRSGPTLGPAPARRPTRPGTRPRRPATRPLPSAAAVDPPEVPPVRDRLGRAGAPPRPAPGWRRRAAARSAAPRPGFASLRSHPGDHMTFASTWRQRGAATTPPGAVARPGGRGGARAVVGASRRDGPGRRANRPWQTGVTPDRRSNGDAVGQGLGTPRRPRGAAASPICSSSTCTSSTR